MNLKAVFLLIFGNMLASLSKSKINNILNFIYSKYRE